MPKPAAPTVLDAAFVAEARDAANLPPLGPPEIAISGRSNVGKSTLLNRLAARRALARVSKTPGRTRGIIFYNLALRLPGGADRRLVRLVDLPGYGYAQVSQDERKAWQRLVEGYVKARSTLRLFLVLLDARREPGAEEKQLCAWLAGQRVPQHLVVTKMDKLGASERGGAGKRRRAAFGPKAPGLSLVSGQTGDGVDDLWRVMLEALGPEHDAGTGPL